MVLQDMPQSPGPGLHACPGGRGQGEAVHVSMYVGALGYGSWPRGTPGRGHSHSCPVSKG